MKLYKHLKFILDLILDRGSSILFKSLSFNCLGLLLVDNKIIPTMHD